MNHSQIKYRRNDKKHEFFKIESIGVAVKIILFQHFAAFF